MSTFILFSGSVLKMHCPLLAVAPPLLPLAWLQAPKEVLHMETSGWIFKGVHSVYMIYEISYTDIWARALIQSRYSLTMYILSDLSCIRGKSDSESSLLLCWDQFPLLFDWHLNKGWFCRVALITSYKTNHQAATTSLIAEHCCTAFTNEQKQPNSS